MSPPLVAPRRPRFLGPPADRTSWVPASFAAPHPAPEPERAQDKPPQAVDAAPAPSRAPPPPPPEPDRASLDRLALAVEALRLAGARLAEQARADALELAFYLARRILEAELKTGPEPLFALVRSAIRRLGETRKITVRLHPLDARVVEEGAGRLTGELNLAQFEVRPDATLERGDCVIDSDLGEVDGRLSARLKALRAALESEPQEGQP